MIRWVSRVVLVPFWILAFSPLSRGGTIFTDFGAGFSFDTSPADAFQIGGTLGNIETAAFTPTVTSVLTSIELATMWASGFDNFRVTLSSSACALCGPGAMDLDTFNSVSFSPSFGVVTLTPSARPLLTAGTTYWLTIWPATDDDSGSWALNNQGVFGPEGFDNAFTPAFDINSSAPLPAFEVDGFALPPTGPPSSTPEPSAFVLSAVGLAALLSEGKLRRSPALFWLNRR